RPLAVTSTTRAPALPDVPTVKEAGIATFEVTLWLALFAPAKTPAAIVTQLNREFTAAIGAAPVRSALLTQGLQPQATTSAEFAKLLAAEIARWSEVVRKANLKPE
ncbi:MAG TPA: tripartite tricarboxylate transporter substrate-binding protein, partial [Candidatus Limnocylindria bacterium]|nr:tripartite tricarboxylate transporter substrate-binding protein [Candidatus Limnocylindria bacterium]